MAARHGTDHVERSVHDLMADHLLLLPGPDEPSTPEGIPAVAGADAVAVHPVARPSPVGPPPRR